VEPLDLHLARRSFLIEHGTRDCVVPTEQSRLLHDALRQALGPERVSLHLLAAGHRMAAFSLPPNFGLVVDFFHRYLR